MTLMISPLQGSNDICRFFARPKSRTRQRVNWTDWQLILGSRAGATGDKHEAMCIVTGEDYGTQSSSLIALPPFAHQRPIWLYAEGPPDKTKFEKVEAGTEPS